MERCIVGIYLGICSITDIRRREIPLLVTGGTIILGLIMQSISGKMSWLMWVGGILIGVFLMGVSKITNEALGYGDCLSVMAAGACLGGVQNLELLLAGLTLAAVFSAILLGTGKADGKYKLPFLPFLLAAHMGITLLEWSNGI